TGTDLDDPVDFLFGNFGGFDGGIGVVLNHPVQRDSGHGERVHTAVFYDVHTGLRIGHGLSYIDVQILSVSGFNTIVEDGEFDIFTVVLGCFHGIQVREAIRIAFRHHQGGGVHDFGISELCCFAAVAKD